MTDRRHWNPEGIAPPASRYSHAVMVTGAQRWLHLAGQIAVAPDGSVPAGLADQIDLCLANVEAGLASAGMTRADLVRLTFYLTDGAPGAVATYRARRDAWIGDAPPPAVTLLIVAGLAAPAFLVEVDAVAAA
jgi:enamine deaminase RidA (YjgF/YER057c/UK114 family)